MSILKYISVFILLLPVTLLFGQDGPLGGKDKIVLENERIEDVIESDKPYLKIPHQEVQEIDLTEINYQSQDLYVETDFEPEPPNPKLLKPTKGPFYSNNFVKVGLGRFITPFAQLYLHDGSHSEYDYGLDFTHHSAHSDRVEYRNFREDFADIHGSYLLDNNKVLAGIKVFNTNYFNYGDTISRATVEQLEDSIRMGFTKFEVGANLLRNYESGQQMDYNLGVNAKLYTGRRNNREFHINLNPDLMYAVNDEVRIGIESGFNFTSAKIHTQNQSRIFIDALPMIQYQKDQLQLMGGVRLNYYNNNADTASVSQIAPKVELRYGVIPEMLTAFVGVDGGMQYNHYYDMMGVNKYLRSDVEIKPTKERFNIYGGISGNLQSKADYTAMLSYKRLDNALVYTVPIDSGYFAASYDSMMSVFGVHIDVNYDVMKELKAGVTLDYNAYNTSTLEKNFHAPPIKMGIFGNYVWEEKLTVGAEINFFGSTPQAVAGDGTIDKQNAFLDLNLSGDYRVTDAISIWLEFNNLLNAKYERWHNYLERPLDVKGGITVAF